MRRRRVPGDRIARNNGVVDHWRGPSGVLWRTTPALSRDTCKPFLSGGPAAMAEGSRLICHPPSLSSKLVDGGSALSRPRQR